MRCILIFACISLPMAAPIQALAQAVCPSGFAPILACTFGDGAKAVRACQDGTTATYAFGKLGQPADLALSRPLVAVKFLPWPGIGGSVWQEAGFENKGVHYILWENTDKNPANPVPYTAGIVVEQNDKLLARLQCDPGSITSGIDRLWDAFTALGQCYDQGQQAWLACQ